MNFLCPNCQTPIKVRRANTKCTNCGANLVQVREEWRVYSFPGKMTIAINVLKTLIIPFGIWSVISKTQVAFVLTSAVISATFITLLAEGLLTGKVRSKMWLLTAEDGWLYYSQLWVYGLVSIISAITFTYLLLSL